MWGDFIGHKEGSSGTCREATHLSWPGSTHTNFRSKEVWTLWSWKKSGTGVVQSCVYRITCPEAPQM